MEASDVSKIANNAPAMYAALNSRTLPSDKVTTEQKIRINFYTNIVFNNIKSKNRQP
jgi:hypothetical protein